MNYRHARQRIGDSSSTNNNISSDNQNTDPNTISTRQLFKLYKRSSDKSASPQSNPDNRKPSNTVTNELSHKLSESDLTKTKIRNYSSRNMLRNSRPAHPSEITGQSGPSTSHYASQERLPSQNLDDLRCYIRLTEDCLTYDLPQPERAKICLLCGMKMRGKSFDQHIESIYHRSQFRKLERWLFDENLDESSLQMSTMKALCDKWYSSYSLPDSLIEMRNAAIIEFEEILGSINPECQLRIHGSSYYGAATLKSDVNIELVHPNSKIFESDHRSKKSIHHRLIDPDAEFGSQFNQHTMHYDLASNPVETLYKIYRIIGDSSRSLPSYPFALTSSLGQLNGKIPTVTLKHRVNGSILSVNCYSERRFNLARLLGSYMLLDSRLEQLSTLIKIWANFCGIDNPDYGSYPPHAYVIMMIYFLQRTQPPVLPCLHDLVVKPPNQPDGVRISDNDQPEERVNEIRDDDLEDEEEHTWAANIDESTIKNLNWISENKKPAHVLFTKFFKSMIDEFSDLTNVITIRTLEPVISRSNAQSKAIEHPLDPANNISRCIASMKTFDFIRDSFFHSYFYLTSIPIDSSLKVRKTIKSDPRDYINLYVNTSRLDSYHSMREPSILLGSLQSGQANYDPISEMIQQKLFARDVETLLALSVSNQGASIPQTLANLYDPDLLRPQNITYSYSCQLCRSTGHTKGNCPKSLIKTLHDEQAIYDFGLDARANLDQTLMKLYSNEAISTKLSSEHNEILGKLKRTINEALDLKLNFVLYGSTVNNFGSCDSDLDICVTVKGNPTGKDVDCVLILEDILKVLETLIVEVHDIEPVFSARVPIIRFKFNQFDIDLSMYNQCAIYNSKLLRTYSLIDPLTAPLCSLVKKFAKACGVADASRGGLSSYAWSLLVIYYLQRIDPPVLPVLQEPKESHVRDSYGVSGWNVWFHDKPEKLPEHPYSLIFLLKGFFLFYGVFDFENYVVAIRKSTQITKFQKSWNGCMIAIEDPFELTYNLANRLSDPMAIFILNFFAQTYSHIVKVQQIVDSNFDSKVTPMKLAKMLFDGKDITKVGPPLRGCLICHKIGHKLKECPEKNKNSRRSPRKGPGRSNPGGRPRR